MPRIGDFVERAPWSSDAGVYPRLGTKCRVTSVSEVGGETWVGVKNADSDDGGVSMPLYTRWVYWEDKE